MLPGLDNKRPRFSTLGYTASYLERLLPRPIKNLKKFSNQENCFREKLNRVKPGLTVAC